MPRLVAFTAVPLACTLLSVNTLNAQGRGGSDWSTSGNDAQRSSWVRSDPKIAKERLQGFQFLWKSKFGDAKQTNALTTPVLLDRLIGYKGFRSLAFVGGSSDSIFVIDTDLARPEWQKKLSTSAAAQGSSANCPGGMTSSVTRPTNTSIAGPPAGRGGGGFGRGGPARSGVGEAGQGAVTLAQAGGGRPGAPPAGPGAPGGPPAQGANQGRGQGRGPGAGPGGGPGAAPGGPPNSLFGGGRGAFNSLFAVSSDGMLHVMHVSNGADIQPPVKFLPPNANAQGLIATDGFAYAATANGCGGAPDAVWAMDLTSKEVLSWKPASGGIAGTAGPAFGPDGTLYIATTGGEIAALEPKTLKLKSAFSAAGTGFTSTPVIFQFKDKTFVAAAAKDGRIYLLHAPETGDLSLTAKSPPYSSAAGFIAGALSSWQDPDGTRWLLAPAGGPVTPGAGFSATNGAVSNGAIVAWKIADNNGVAAFEPGWVSRDLVSPGTPMIINGVVFALSSGERAPRSQPAVLYALDAATGKELWTSGKSIASPARRGGLSGGGSQLYVGTNDGTLYAFGFPIEH